MTENRTTELLPCPICGKKVYIGLYGGEPDYWWMVHGGMHYDECQCRLFMESCKFELEDETRVDYDENAMGIRGGLARRWNTRAELGSGTCKLIDTTSPGNDDYWNSAKCSECGAGFTCAIFGREPNTPDANYCPNCGRKVVG